MTAERKAYLKAYRKAWAKKPKWCGCKQFMGVYPEGGNEWVCQRCHDIEAKLESNRAKRAHVPQPIMADYRLCLPGGI